MLITIAQGAFLPVPPELGGAVEKMWFELGKCFVQKGHDVFQVSKVHSNFPRYEWIQGVEHRRVKGYNTPRSIVRLKLLDLLYSLRVLRALPASDILVSNTFFLPILCRSKIKGKLYIDVQRMPKGQIRLYSRAARLRANSSAVADAIVRECPQAKDRVKVIPNPLPFIPNTDSPGSKEKVVIYTGRIHPEKGIELLLESLRAFNKQEAGRDWRLEIAGPYETALGGGGESYFKRLKSSTSGLPVVWHGMISDTEQLNRLYQRASVFAYPSLAEKGETFGLSVLEAMAWGCVPVVSDLACFRDFVKDGKNGLIFDHRTGDRVHKLEHSLIRLASDPILRQGMQQYAMAVRESHALNTVADLFLADFRSLSANMHPLAGQ